MARVLYIEDNEQNLYLVTFILEKSGHQVIAARNGREGLEAAAREQPDLVLLDFQLPGMDGLEVLRQLRSVDSTRDIPVVAVTSYAMLGDREKFLSAGCDGYLEKPINPDLFLPQIEAFLRGEKGEEKA